MVITHNRRVEEEPSVLVNRVVRLIEGRNRYLSLCTPRASSFHRKN